MCRLAAYMGKEIRLDQFLIEHEHSLLKQSWSPKEMQDGTINADGYGFAWLVNDNIVCSYKNILPIWSDSNLQGLGHSLQSRLWMANVRGATPGQGINEANTQPFHNNNLIFMHNGCLKPFDNRIKSGLLENMSTETQADINGDSDSLYLFALLKEYLAKGNTINDAILSLMDILKDVCDKSSALLNIIISDGNSLYACRSAINASCPSLYYFLGNTAVWIASEPLSPNDWITFSENSFTQFNNSGDIITIKL